MGDWCYFGRSTPSTAEFDIFYELEVFQPTVRNKNITRSRRRSNSSGINPESTGLLSLKKTASRTEHKNAIVLCMIRSKVPSLSLISTLVFFFYPSSKYSPCVILPATQLLLHLLYTATAPTAYDNCNYLLWRPPAY